MSLEDKFDKLAEESYKFHGEVRASLDNLSAYIGAVSGNQKEATRDLKGHIESTAAHGIGVREKDISKVAAWVGLLVAVVTLGMHLMKQ